ncbi:MAG: hypothetical protein KDA33_05010 [Phycisphaerales bacterium]|nr:hypothetical protein [Phycisphaerales bacterium]
MDTAADIWPAMAAGVRAAAADGADLIVLPEIAYPSYLLESRERYFQGDIERTREALSRYAAMARRFGVWLVAGVVEERGDTLFNSAAVLDSAGVCVAMARKQFLWDCDNEWFEAGLDSAVVETPWGRMGALICADLRVPEILATLVARGAEFVVQPTAWVNAALGTGGYRNIQPEFLVRGRALEFGVPVASCSKSGNERSRMGYVGQSMIVDAAGATLAQAPIVGDASVIAEISPQPGRSPRVSPSELADLRMAPVTPSATNEQASITIDATSGIDFASAALNAAGVRVARVSAAALSSYVTARIEALRGVQVIVADGEPIDIALVRTRSAENRVFIVAGDANSLSLIVDPVGAVRWSAGHSVPNVEIDPAEADVKAFTPQTPIWGQRRPERYEFGLRDA